MQSAVLLDDRYLLVTRSETHLTADEERDSWGKTDLHPFRKSEAIWNGLGKPVLGDPPWIGHPPLAASPCLDRRVGQDPLQTQPVILGGTLRDSYAPSQPWVCRIGTRHSRICCEGVSVVLFNSQLSLCLDRFKGCAVHGGCHLCCTAQGAAFECHLGCLWQGLGLFTLSLVSSFKASFPLPSLTPHFFLNTDLPCPVVSYKNQPIRKKLWCISI